jgi:hypothetical protein
VSTGRWTIPERLAKGSSMMLTALPRLFRAPDWREALSRAFVVLLAASMAVTAVALHPWVLGLLTAAWVVTALVISRPAPGAQPSQANKTTPAPGAEGFHRDDVVELLHELLGEHNGVHLSRVAQQLANETGTPWKVADARKVLEAAGITVRHSVRVPGQGVAVGVHRRDIPSPGLREGARSGVAPQVRPATATATPPIVEDIGGGAGRVIRHPDEKRRYDVRQ